MTYLIKIYLVRVKIHIPQVLKVSYKTEINPYVGINMFVYLYVNNLNYNIHIFAVTWIIQFIWVIIDLMPIIEAWKTKKNYKNEKWIHIIWSFVTFQFHKKELEIHKMLVNWYVSNSKDVTNLKYCKIKQ